MGDAQGKMWLIESFLPSGRKTKLKGPRESFRASEVKKIWKERARENEKERERESERERERQMRRLKFATKATFSRQSYGHVPMCPQSHPSFEH